MTLNVKHLPCRYNGLNLIPPPPTADKYWKKKTVISTVQAWRQEDFLGLTAQKVYSNKWASGQRKAILKEVDGVPEHNWVYFLASTPMCMSMGTHASAHPHEHACTYKEIFSSSWYTYAFTLNVLRWYIIFSYIFISIEQKIKQLVRLCSGIVVQMIWVLGGYLLYGYTMACF